MNGTTNIGGLSALVDLSLSINGTLKVSYDGTVTKSLDITLASLGAAATNHTHDTIYSKTDHAHDEKYFSLSGGNVNGDINIVQVGTSTTFHGLTGYLGNTDLWRIGGANHATTPDSGYLELATADNGIEPIYVRQYGGSGIAFSRIDRSATLLDEAGNTYFPGTVYQNGNNRLLSASYICTDRSVQSTDTILWAR